MLKQWFKRAVLSTICLHLGAIVTVLTSLHWSSQKNHFVHRAQFIIFFNFFMLDTPCILVELRGLFIFFYAPYHRLVYYALAMKSVLL